MPQFNETASGRGALSFGHAVAVLIEQKDNSLRLRCTAETWIGLTLCVC